jgi:hypothetical protein
LLDDATITTSNLAVAGGAPPMARMNALAITALVGGAVVLIVALILRVL